MKGAPATPAINVDLYSDTLTKPTPGMRRAIYEAEVGDEQKAEDPTTNRLLETVAGLLGKEAAVFLPSGTMCNEIAYAVHCRPGDEILMDRTGHPFHFEGGGPGALSGATICTLDGRRGIYTAEQVAEAIRPPSRYAPRSRLVSVEQTSNLGGGSCWPLETIRAVCDVAHRHGLAAHMDGARLFNAVAATGVKAADFAASFDSVWVDFTKGLGAPIGACLAGTAAFIDEAWRHKQRWGGAMRQSGIVAAAALYALEHHVERLAEDHANARLLAESIATLPGVTLNPSQVETNLVYFDVTPSGLSADEVVDRLLREHGVRMGAMGPTLIRAVTHLDVDQAGVRRAAEALAQVLGKPARS